MSEDSDRKPVFPVPIEVFGITGEHESGKTTLAITACPGPETLVYDFEKSSKSYENDLGFHRIDVPDEMQVKLGGKAKPIDVFKWWIAHVRSIKPGQYRVIVVDPASDIEQGLADYVNANPREFNRTPGQYMKMSGLMWGDMKAFWKSILADIAARCETFFFVVHMGTVWKGDRPSKERKAKGKATLFELASLYLKMERNKDVSVKPSAVVLKTRLSKMVVNHETGEVDIKPILPPRIPVATCHAIRQYCLKPADFNNLKPEELIGEVKLTEDEKLLLQAEIATANRDTALAQAGGHSGSDDDEPRRTRLGGVSNRPKASTSRSEGSASNSTQADVEASKEELADDTVTEAASEDEPGESEAGEAPEGEGTAGDEAAGDGADSQSDTESGSEPSGSIGEQLEEACNEATTVTSHDPRFPSPDSPVGKGQLGSLRQCIASYVKRYPDKQSNIMEAVRRRNPAAKSEADLTQGQAEDMEASLLRILNGPHEDPQPTATSTPDAGKGAASTRAKSKR